MAGFKVAAVGKVRENLLKLVYYSFSPDPAKESDNETRMMQLYHSVSSLRKYNRDLSVHLNLFGKISPYWYGKLEACRVIIHELDSLPNRLNSWHPIYGQYLSEYRVIHKWLALETLFPFNPSQVLYLDNDTYFCGDIERLFQRYRGNDLAAREEAFSRVSHLGYNADLLNEDELERLQFSVANFSRFFPPINLGVVLLNNRIWEDLVRKRKEFLSYAWRFLLWMAMNPSPQDRQFVLPLRKNLADIPDAEKSTALKFPFASQWILDEVAFWMLFSTLENSWTIMNQEDVLQGGSEIYSQEAVKKCTMIHYLSQNTYQFLDFVGVKGLEASKSSCGA